MSILGMPKGKGLVPDRIGTHTGHAPNNQNSTALTGKLAETLLSSNEVGFLNVNGTTDWESLLNRGDEFNKFILSNNLYGEGLDDSNITDAANIGFSVHRHIGSLFNEIVKIMTRAAKIIRNGVVKDVSNSMSITREYQNTTRGCRAVLPAEAERAIKAARLQIQDEISGRIGENLINNPSLDAKRKESAKQVLNLITVAFSGELARMQQAMAAGLPEQILAAIEDESIEVSFAKVVTELSASILQKIAQGSQDPIADLRDDNLARNFHKRLVVESLENTFGLAKSLQVTGSVPNSSGRKTVSQYLADLLSLSKDYMQNLTTDKHDVDGVTVTGDDGANFPIVGILIATEEVHKELMPLLRNGKRIGSARLEYHDNSDYYKERNGTMIRLNNDKERPTITSDPTKLLELVDENNTNMDGTINKLIPVGKNVFGTDKPKGGSDYINKGEPAGVINIDKDNVSFLVTSFKGKMGAVVIHTKVENPMQMNEYDQMEDVAASGLKTINNVMRTTVGDFDYRSHMPVVNTYHEKVNLSDKDSVNAIGRYECKPVTAHTEDVSMVKHTFGPEELKKVILDPFLYDQNHIQKLVDFQNKVEVSGVDFADLQEKFSKDVNVIANRIDLLTTLYNQTGAAKAAGDKLATIELSPFFGFVNDKNNPQLVSSEPGERKRNILGDIPMCAHNLMDHVRAAVMVAPEDFKKIDALVKDTKEFTKQDDIKNLVAGVKDILKNIFPKVANYTTCVELSSDKTIAKNVILPALTNFRQRTTADADDFENTPINLQNNTQPWYECVNPDKSDLVYMGNANIIVNMLGLTNKSTKLLALIFLNRKTTPSSLSESIDMKYPLGFSVDFLKVERMYCNDMTLTTPKSVDIIVTPQPVKVTSNADGSLDFLFTTKIDTASNMTSATGLRVPNAIPKVRADNICSDFGAKPKLALDYITTSSYETIADYVDTLNDYIDDADRNLIKELFKEMDEERMEISGDYTGVNRFTESYVGVLRPARQLTDDPLPYLGVARHEMLSGSSTNSRFVNFYSTLKTTNPFFSNLGSVYQQRYHSATHFITKGRVSINFDTFNVNRDGVVSETTKLLEDALVFEDESSFKASEVDSIRKYCASKSENTIKHFNKFRLSGREGNMLGNGHLAAREGYCVPHTQYTDEKILAETRARNANVYSVNGNFAVQSVFRKNYLGPRLTMNF